MNNLFSSVYINPKKLSIIKGMYVPIIDDQFDPYIEIDPIFRNIMSSVTPIYFEYL